MFAVVIMLAGFLVVGLAIGLLLTFLYNAVWPEVTASLASGAVEEGMVLVAVAVALVLTAVLVVVRSLVSLGREVSRRRERRNAFTRTKKRRLHRRAVRTDAPVVGIKLARVCWSAPDREPTFAGASAGRTYRREDTAYCDIAPEDGELMWHDQTPRHRCGFYALFDEAVLRQEFAEAVGMAEDAPMDRSTILDTFDADTHMVHVAMHGNVICYERAIRSEGQTVIAIDVPAACAQESCEEPVVAVAAVGWPLGLCTAHADEPDMAWRAIALPEFVRRYHIDIRPVLADGTPVIPDEPTLDAADHDRAATDWASAPVVDHADDRIDGWIAGGLDLVRSEFVTDGHRLTAHTLAAQPVSASRQPPASSHQQALARVRLGGEVTVHHHSVASRDVQVWDLYLPERCQYPDCDRLAAMVDRGDAFAESRCHEHASPAARPPHQHAAEHGVSITFADSPPVV